jgi:hypothetical protein
VKHTCLDGDRNCPGFAHPAKANHTLQNDRKVVIYCIPGAKKITAVQGCRVASSEILSREPDLNGSKIVPAENRLLIKLSNETQPMKLGK